MGTERVEGHLLDKGFQVLLTSYPEVKKLMRLYEINPEKFLSGINVYYRNKWYPLYNPLKHPLSVWQNRRSPFVSFADMVKLSSLYLKMALKSQTPYFEPSRLTALAFLREHGISDLFIDTVVRPFFGGTSLDPALKMPDDMFLWILHFFMEGNAVLPRQGMRGLVRNLLSKLSATTFRYHTPVRAVHGQTIYLEEGEEVSCDKIVIATDVLQAHQFISSLPEMKMRGMTTLYFTVDATVFKEPPLPMLHLNGEGEGSGPINHLAFNSVVQPTYAPAEKVLVSATVISKKWQGAYDLVEAVTDQLSRWFKIESGAWRHLRTYAIEHALPDQSAPPPLQGCYQIDRYPDICLCGEYVDHASINGALGSGRRAADVVHESIKRLRTLSP